MSATFYCVSSDVYFLGAVAMINSLRLHGHAEPIYLLDAGLKPEQRALLEPEVTIVEAAEDAEPFMLKTVAPLAYPAEVMVLIDADMIVTRNLGELIERAERGGVVGFRNEVDRYFDEWRELLDAPGIERHPYLSSGFVVLGGGAGRRVIGSMERAKGLVDFARTQFEVAYPEYPLNTAGPAPAPGEYPFYLADQDLLNAVIATSLGADQVVALDSGLAPVPPFDGVRVLDPIAVRCAGPAGREPYVLHHYLAKPWLEPTHHGVYSQLLRRLLIGPGLAIDVPPATVPRRLRSGPAAYLERTRVNAREQLRYRLFEPLAARRRRRSAGAR